MKTCEFSVEIGIQNQLKLRLIHEDAFLDFQQSLIEKEKKTLANRDSLSIFFLLILGRIEERWKHII